MAPQFAVEKDAFQMSWIREIGYCLSPICSDWQMPSENTAGRQVSSSDSTNLEHSALVPNSSGDIDRLSSSFTGRSVPTARPLQLTSSTSPQEPAPVSRLEGIQENHSAEGISKHASTLRMEQGN